MGVLQWRRQTHTQTWLLYDVGENNYKLDLYVNTISLHFPELLHTHKNAKYGPKNLLYNKTLYG